MKKIFLSIISIPKNLIKNNYRHAICMAVTLISLGFGFLFPNGIPRLAETVRDLGVSAAYYFCEIFMPGNNPIRPTVLDMPSWTWSEDVWEPLGLFPWTWEEFKVLWVKFWQLFIDRQNIVGYFTFLGDLLFYGSRFALIALPLLMLVLMLLNSYKSKHCTDRHKKSAPLQIFEMFLFKVIYPIIGWCKDFVDFCKERPIYYRIWLVVWAVHFNVIALFVAFLAFYTYFAVSFDFLSIYTQVLKLLDDLAPMVRFIPAVAWSCIGIGIYNHICRSMAFQRLYHAERCNRAFLSSRGVLTVVYGQPRVGKTQLITSMSISSEIDMFDRSFNIMLKIASMFPNFPWQIFRDNLKKMVKKDVIVDFTTARMWVKSLRPFFDRISVIDYDFYQCMRAKHKLLSFDYTFGYDYTHYPITYNDELKISHLYELLEEYACAYLMFSIQTTLLHANYSIRTDSILVDLGNMLYRDNDFLNRDPQMQEAYSKHAHILDFDMMRLGKKMMANNPKGGRPCFGTWVITEIDKEFKNMQELKEVKINANECNQRNDLHDACLMTIGHSVVIFNEHFIRIIADLQRPTAWGAGGRENGDVIYISEKEDFEVALPLMSPYYLFETVFSFLKDKWDDFNTQLEINRSDKTLFIYLMRNAVSIINNHYDKIKGKFGMQVLNLEIQSGELEGEVKKDKWRLIYKKDRSRRYRTDCLQAIYNSYEPNAIHIDKFIMYAGELSTYEENQLQNSYFQNDIRKMKELNK